MRAQFDKGAAFGVEAFLLRWPEHFFTGKTGAWFDGYKCGWLWMRAAWAECQARMPRRGGAR